ncbi:NUDIX hydrolase [Microbacterium sp.]|uniref:NUDIX hydrolase n=1 Tax=Microbacterium sp. TaxID=51671 RepID=UPI003A94AA58
MAQAMLDGGTAVLLREREASIETLLIQRPDRGSFGGAWVFPGGIVEAGDIVAGEDEVQIAARAAVRECEEEVGLRPIDARVFSCWVPPVEAPKRVRTWFFLAHAPEGEIHPAPHEVMEAAWLSPVDALQRHAQGSLMLFPPTWITLSALAEHTSIAEALASVTVPETYTTYLLGGGVFVWAGDAQHPSGGTGRHRLETDMMPWRYTRD